MRTIIATTTLLLAAYMVFLQLSGPAALPRNQSQWQDNLTVMERFQTSSVAIDSAYVGSSLTRRLTVERPGQCAFNLSLDGDSALTGLALVQARDRPLRQVFVEINVPQRPENKLLLAEALRHASYRLPIFLTENIPVNRLIAFVNERRGVRPRVAPTGAAFDGALKLQQDSYKQRIDATELASQLARFRQLVTEIESRSTSVVFFELPVDGSLENTVRAQQIRSAFRDAFPSHSMVTFEELTDRGAVQTLDGVHLADGVAERVSSQIQARFPSRCSGSRS